MHLGVSNAPYRSKQQNLLDCGFKRAAMTIASIIDMTRFFCHDALDNARQDKVWQKVKDKMASAGGSLSFEIVKTLTAELSKSAVGL